MVPAPVTGGHRGEAAPEGMEAAAAATTNGAPLSLEFALDPAAAGRFARHPAVLAARAGRRGRTTAEELIWLDTADGALAGRGLVLERTRRGERRMLTTRGGSGEIRLPGAPPAAAPDPLPEPDGLAPVAAFSGRRTVLPLGDEASPLQAELLVGKLRAVAAERPVARLVLSGDAAAVLGLARRLAPDLPLLPPAAALAEEGRALARAERLRPHRRGMPDPGTAENVEEALLAAIGHLLEVMLHQAPLCRIAEGPEGVHQMRVALRRLRSVLKAFRPAVDCAAIRGFDEALKALARHLGAARDLDVFLAGIGAEVAAALPGERRIAQLRRAVEARRAAAYAALREALDGPGFRLLALDGLALILERPWRAAATAGTTAAPDQAAMLAEPLPAFASRLLDKRWHRLRARGEEIQGLDEAALHELRLSAKRLRYAAEFFAPLWPGKAARRFLKRLSALQDGLGLANDAAMAREIVKGVEGAAPAWAVGAVEGFAVARAVRARRKAIEAWEDLIVAKPFWSDL